MGEFRHTFLGRNETTTGIRMSGRCSDVGHLVVIATATWHMARHRGVTGSTHLSRILMGSAGFAEAVLGHLVVASTAICYMIRDISVTEATHFR